MELLTLRDERRVFQERFDSLEAVFVPNCTEFGDATSLRLVLKNKQRTVFKETLPKSFKTESQRLT